MTREEVAEWLKFMQECEHNKADSIVPCTTEIALGIAIEALKQQEEVKPFHKCTSPGSYTLLENSHYGFCPYCGKKVKWE